MLLSSMVVVTLTRHMRPSVLLPAGAGRSLHGAVAIGHGNAMHAFMSDINELVHKRIKSDINAYQDSWWHWKGRCTVQGRIQQRQLNAIISRSLVMSVCFALR